MGKQATYPVPGDPPVLSDNALTVLRSRYLIKDERGKVIETPGELFSRVAAQVAQVESRYGADTAELQHWHKRYYELMASLKFLPNSPALMNAGRRGMLSACFVLPVEDSIEGIFEAVKQTALIQQAGGGTGFCFDRLRPTGDRVASSGGTTSGPISFWRVFCETTNAIQQGAFRRGANMGMMSLEHPDILKFLHAKQNLKAFTNFNISVKVTDRWMEKLLRAPRTVHVVKNPRTQRLYVLPKNLQVDSYSLNDLQPIDSEQAVASLSPRRFYTVRDLWRLIIRCAHQTGEPGLAFIDRINQANPTPSLGPIEATNPCGEQPLLPYEACTLGSVNLTKFVAGPEGRGRLDWPALAETVKLAVRFLDNIVDCSIYPVDDVEQMAHANRKIGLGVMGFADCLFMLGIPYDCEKAVEFGRELMCFVNDTARQASCELAEQRGPFPNWRHSIWATQRNLKIRNAAITCIAPTGTISIIADCSPGIEPVYSLVFLRQILDGKRMLAVNPVFRRMAERHGLYNATLEQEILASGTIQHIKRIPARIRRLFRCAYDIAPRWHVRMQAAFQEHCDAAVSKTVNLPADASVAAVERVYRMAYELGCKGVTVYRKGSRQQEPMTLFS